MRTTILAICFFFTVLGCETREPNQPKQPASLPATARQANVLIEFWAPWCVPCTQFAPIIAEVEKELTDSLIVRRIDIDQEPTVAARYNIQVIPAGVLLHYGNEVGRLVGLQSKDEMLAFIDAHSRNR